MTTTMNTKPGETTNDPKEKIGTGSVKYDAGKPPIFSGLLSYFPRAAGLVAGVSAFGATKYQWNGWKGVDDGVRRYTDALVRHLTAEAKGEVVDLDSGLLHAGHSAWNALARLELMLMEDEKARDGEDLDWLIDQLEDSVKLKATYFWLGREAA